MGAHDIVLANAAKEQLKPLGFHRKGRSRIWLADHGWWLTIVEFQPSSWSKGSYLNVGAHWLWVEQGYLSFDYGSRVAAHEKYVSDTQFATAARQLAVTAAVEAQSLTSAFSSIAAAAAVLLQREYQSEHRAQGGWSAYHAGMAAGLAGMILDATKMLTSITDARVQPMASRMAGLLDHPDAFMHEARSVVASERSALKLKPADRALF